MSDPQSEDQSLKVLSLGMGGVHLDMDPLLIADNQVVLAQNVSHDATSSYGGAVRCRPGLMKFNQVALGGAVLGGLAMPVVGTAGAPPTVSDPNSPTGTPPPGGPIAAPGTPTPPPGGTPGGTPAPTIFTPTRLFNGARILVIGRGDTTEATNDYGNSWFVGDANFADMASIVFTGTGTGQTPAGPPGGTQVQALGAPSAAGQLTTIANGVLYYPQGTAAPAVSATLPVIRRLTPDGLSDKVVATIPDNPQVLAIAPVPSHAVSVNALITESGNGDAIYCAVYDRVTTGVSAGFYGRVLRIAGLDSGSYAMTEIFNSFNTNAFAACNGTPVVPFALANFLGRVWLGIYTGGTAGGTFVQLRPDPTQPNGWGVALGTTIADANVGDILCMATYNGLLYVGDVANGATFSKIYSYTSLNVAAAVLTSSDAGGAQNPNGFVSMVVFNGKLFASWYNTTSLAKIYAFDGTTWTTPWTGSAVGTAHPVTLQVDNGVLYAFGTKTALAARPVFLWSSDGITFTDASANFPYTNSGFSIPVLFGINQP